VDRIEFQPIGFFCCDNTQRVEAPRQATLAPNSCGYVQLHSSIPLSVLEDLEGFERIWLIYHFHQNSTWKPLVRPPRGAEKKRGVFATRSPYRPNAIGMSCVRLEKMDGHKIWCQEHDLLNGTPILDIKPYVELSDRFDQTRQGWLENLVEYSVDFSRQSQEKVKWLEEKLGKNLFDLIKNQLSFEPTNSKIKRVEKCGEYFCLSYRTWRFDFELTQGTVSLVDLRSGYSSAELLSQDDPYQDKDIHRLFLESFPL
jgi:tRNA-Thr(GGU) m(6)t(6)A37 methyltransferase TsaA